eukprot:gene32589-biopygen23372
MYEKVEEMQNGKPVYIKVGSSGKVCCWYDPDGQWLVSSTKNKEDNENTGYAHSIFAYSIETGLAAPELATQWNVYLDDKWEVQPAIAVAVLSGAEVHAAKVAADAAAAAAVAASGFTVAGATGNNADRVNGAFSKTGAMQNGKPVYSKDGDADMWCYCAPDGVWYVTNTANKDANKDVGWATSTEEALAAPHLAKAWQIYVNDAWVLQPAAKLTATSAALPAASGTKGKAGAGGRLPVIFPCLCKFCKVCALKAEAAAQQQQPQPAAKKGKGKGKKKKKGDEQKPTPCLNCKTPCNIPVNDLLLDEALLNKLAGGGSTAAPLCDVCDEQQATKHCGDCKKIQLFCDDCFAHAHRSAKNQEHTPTPIHDHLASSATASGGAPAASKMMCSIHTDKPLEFFCDDCQMLVCATCGILHHNGHRLKPVGEAVQQQRDAIDAAATVTASACADTTSTIKALRQVEAKLDSNRDIAKQNIIAGFRRVSQASLSESKSLCKRVDEVHKEKTDAVKAQIFALEAAETRSEEAVALARSTLQGATAEQVFQMKKLFVDGLAQVKNHGLAMEQCRAATLEVTLSSAFDRAIAQMAELMQLNVGNTKPAASIAFGEGVETAHAGTGKVTEFVVTAIEFGTGKQSTADGDDVAVRVVPKDKGVGGGGGGGGAAAAAAPANGGKRKRGSSGGGAASAFKKSKTGDAASSATGGNGGVFEAISGAAVDNGDGTYKCSYTLPDGAEEKEWALEVLLNGEHVVGSPFALNVEAAVTSLGGVEIKGAAGMLGTKVNGMYEKVEEMQNGKPVYIKVGTSGMVCCWYGPSGKWYVSSTTEKDANRNAAFAHSIAAGLAAPELATQWNVSLGDKWEVEPAVTVAVLSGAEVHTAKVAADAAAAAALAASGFTIAGATGGNAHFVNGAFSKTGEMQNGKPVYSKDGDAGMWCYCGPDGQWYVAETADKDGNKNRGCAAAIEEGLAAPHLAKAWQVFVNGVWVLQPAMKLTST